MNFQILKNINSILKSNEPFMASIKKLSKEEFANNEDYINICIGIANEINKLLACLGNEVFILNSKLFEIIRTIKTYTNNLFTNYKIPNSYKLYDLFVIDLPKLKNFLDIEGE